MKFITKIITLATMVSSVLAVPWHLDRITKRSTNDMDNTYPYSDVGSCHRNKSLLIHTYILDTGIDTSHKELEGRATFLKNFADDNTEVDGAGHGTHCAGLVGSKSYGVCRDAQLFSVRVLNKRGSGSDASIINGINYVYDRHIELSKSNPGVRSIISLSLGGGFYKPLNNAIERILQKSNTIYFSVASGNDNSDACSLSPSSAHGIFSVMASTHDDDRANFSDYGVCADLYAPGMDITSTFPGNKTKVMSGTSMSTPIIAGVLNHYVDMYPDLNMEGIKKRIIVDATKGVIHEEEPNTNNLLVYLHRQV